MIKKRDKVKGSVLFTVVSVMSIMIVLVCAALTLAGSANRRAHINYANHQTQYTARSVVQCMKSLLDEQGDAIVGNVDLDLLNNSIDSSMGKVTKASIEKLGTVSSLSGINIPSTIPAKPDSFVYKLTATVSMTGQENTVSLYCVNGQIITPSIFNSALTSLGGLMMTNAGGLFTGDIYSHLSGNAGSDPVYINERFEVVGSYGTDSDLYLFTGGADWKIDGYNKGVYIGGNFIPYDCGSVDIDFFEDVKAGKKYTDLPYVYIGNKFEPHGNAPVTIGTPTRPFIVMADSIVNGYALYSENGTSSEGINNNMNIYGDVYLYEEVVKEGKTFESYIASNADSKIDGNLYSQGTVNIVGADSVFANNIVANELKFWGNKNNTTGSVVANTVNMDMHTYSNSTWNFGGGLFVDPDNFRIADGGSINGIKYDDSIKNYKPTTDEPGEEEPEVVPSNWKEHIEEYNEPKNIRFNYTYDNNASPEEMTFTVNYDFGELQNEYEDGTELKLVPKQIKFNIDTTDTFLESNLLHINFNSNDFSNYNDLNVISLPINISGSTISIDFDSIYNTTDDYNLKNHLSSVNLKDLTGSVAFKFTNNWQPQYDNGKTIEIKSVELFFDVEVISDDPEEETPPVTPADTMVNADYYLKLVNDTVFDIKDENGVVTGYKPIIITDIDKTITLVKEYDSVANITKLTIMKNGQPIQFTEVAYDDVGNPVYKTFSYFDYDKEYDKFLRAVVATVTFPESMRKDKVFDTNGGFVYTGFMKSDYNADIFANSKTYEDVEAYLTGSNIYTYCAITEDKWKKIDSNGEYVLSTVPSGTKYINNPYYDPATANWFIWSSCDQNDPANWKYGFLMVEVPNYDPVYEVHDETAPITENCILTGNFENGTLVIDPGNDELYIGLYNFRTSNATIIIEDGGGGRVNFFVPREGIDYYTVSGNDIVQYKTSTLWDNGLQEKQNGPVGQITKYWFRDCAHVSFNNSEILSRSYYEQLHGVGSTGKITIGDVPNIYLYMDSTPKSDPTSADMEIYMESSLISGYIMAPTATSLMYGAENYTIEYGGKTYNNKISVIGSAIFGTTHFSEDTAFMYIDPSGADPDGDPDAVPPFYELYYQAS